jgi:hypothetical protein
MRFRSHRGARLRREDFDASRRGRNDPKVIAAYLGVADEEVEHVEAEARE